MFYAAIAFYLPAGISPEPSAPSEGTPAAECAVESGGRAEGEDAGEVGDVTTGGVGGACWGGGGTFEQKVWMPRSSFAFRGFRF